jgi:hypothetical protein
MDDRETAALLGTSKKRKFEQKVTKETKKRQNEEGFN